MKPPRSLPFRWWWLLSLPLLASLLPQTLGPLAAWSAAADSLLAGALFRARGALPLPLDPLVVAIDSESLALDQQPDQAPAGKGLRARMGPWPWPRALQAELAARVLEAGAARVIFNIVYAQPSLFGPEDDRAFARRLQPWRHKVVLAAALTLRDQEGVSQARLDGPVPAIAAAGFAGPGLTNLLQSPQGITEAIPGSTWLQQELADLSLPPLRPLAFAAIQGPLPKRPLGINYRGGNGQVRLLPAWQLEQAPRQLFRGRTVLIGATAPELGNLQETPFGALNGTEVQAAALASVLEAKGLWRLPEPLEGLLLVLWTLSIGLVLGRSRQAIRSLALGAGLTAIACAAVVLPWWLASLWLPATSLLSIPLFALLCRAGPQAWQEVRERAYLHQVLARRVSPALLQAILRQPDPFWNQLGGRRHRCVVLFSDLVGFTALSSRLPTAELFPLLNRYFATMAQPVIEEEGLLDKFIGDALMAEFGLPRSRGDRAEALAAVRAALGMQRNLEQLNRELADQGIEPLQHGIGLHVGEVIAGNLGSPQRLEFTAVGMAVNVACRLETLTRRWPQHPILITADLLALVADQVEVEALGAHALNGVPAPVEVYALLGWRPDSGPASTGPA